MLKIKFIQKALFLWLTLALTAFVDAANFTYDGINRRDPVGEVELRTFAAVGQIQCNRVKTGAPRVSTGFVLDIGQGDDFALIMTSGHVLRDQTDNEFNLDCLFVKNNSSSSQPLEHKHAGNLVQEQAADFIKNDWGATIVRPNPFLERIAVSNYTFDELMQLLAEDKGEIKLYSRNQEPNEGIPRIQVSDKCSIWQPTPRAILGSGHSLYTNCDSASSGSAGALVIEFTDGRVEAIGIMSGSVQTNSVLKRILAAYPNKLSMEEVHHAIDIIPSPESIINIAIPLIPGMRERSLEELFDDYLNL